MDLWWTTTLKIGSSYFKEQTFTCFSSSLMIFFCLLTLMKLLNTDFSMPAISIFVHSQDKLWRPKMFGQNYLRYLSFFALCMLNVNENHPGDEVLLRVGAFSVFRPFTSGSKCVMDKTIKEIFMLHAKSWIGFIGVGISGINTKTKTYQRWAERFIKEVNYSTKSYLCHSYKNMMKAINNMILDLWEKYRVSCGGFPSFLSLSKGLFYRLRGIAMTAGDWWNQRK